MSLVWYCKERVASPLLPPSLSPSLPPVGVAFLSSPPHSHAGSRRRESTAAPRPVWNAPKFWNLKPWRGYLPGGSPESVSNPKTQPRWGFYFPRGKKKKCKFFLVEPGGIFSLRAPLSPSLLRVLISPCFPLRSRSSGEPSGGTLISGHSRRRCRCVRRGSPVRLSRTSTVKLRTFQAPNFFDSRVGALVMNAPRAPGCWNRKKKKGLRISSDLLQRW